MSGNVSGCGEVGGGRAAAAAEAGDLVCVSGKDVGLMAVVRVGLSYAGRRLRRARLGCVPFEFLDERGGRGTPFCLRGTLVDGGPGENARADDGTPPGNGGALVAREATSRSVHAILEAAVDGIVSIDERGGHPDDQPRRRAAVRLCRGRGDRPERQDAHAGPLPGRARRLPRPLPRHRGEEDHRHRPRGGRPEEGRHDLPHGPVRRRGPGGDERVSWHRP